MKLVKVKNLDTGEIGTLPEDQAGQAIASGAWAQASKEEFRKAELDVKHGGLGGMAKAGLAGAARGVSFGASDYAARELNPALANEMAELKEVHPITSTVTEIGAAVAPMAFSGGAGAVGTAAKLAPTSLVGRAGSAVARGAEAVVGTGAESLLGRVAQRAIPMAAQGALEGAAYGAGQVVSENALGGHKITAEKLLAGAEHGMFLGGAVGGGVGVLGELGKAAASKAFKFANESSLKDWLQEIADKSTIKAAGADFSQIKNMPNWRARVHDMAEGIRTAKLENGEKVFRPGQTSTELGEKLSVAADESSARLAKTVDKIDEIAVANPETKPNFARALQRVNDDIVAPLKLGNTEHQMEQAALVEKALKKIGAKVDAKIGFKEGRQIVKDLDHMIYDAKANTVGLPGRPNPRVQILEQARGILSDELEIAADAAAASIGDDALKGLFQSQKSEWRNLNDAKKMTERWEVKDFGNRWASPTDYLGAIGTGLGAVTGGLGTLGTLAASAAGGLAHNVIRERGQSVVAHVADRIANLNTISQVTAGVDQKIASGVRDALQGELSRAATQIADSPRQKAFDKVVDKVATVVADPAKANDFVAQRVGVLAQHSPGVAAAAANVVAADMKYVADSMPPSVKNQKMIAGKSRVPTSEIHRVERMIRAIEAPLTILPDINQGRLTASAAQAVRDRRPEIVNQIKTEIMTEMVNSGRIPTYRVRQQISTLIGSPVDFETSPAFKASIQQIYAPPQQQQGAPPAAAPKRRPATKLASNQLTPSQKLNFE